MDGRRNFFKKGILSDDIVFKPGGQTRTDGLSLTPIIGKDEIRYAPGFTPIEAYSTNSDRDSNGNVTWYGHLLESHFDYVGSTLRPLSTNDKFNESDNDGLSGNPFSKRDSLLRFNDSSLDYFQNDLFLDGKTPIESGDDISRYANNGEDQSLKLSTFGNTSYENSDPVIYGFEVIVDAISSPLLNGSIDDFINQFSTIREVASRKHIYEDFKVQFVKLFKTLGSVNITQNPKLPGKGNSSLLQQYAHSQSSKSDIRRPGRKAYLSYYLQKISGLSKLVESNTSSAKNYLTDYNKDIITLTFLEDVSGTLSTLSNLYKLLYWSKINGKGIIPENLLRFNCSIVISETRHFNRVRKAINDNNIEVIKDNVSRYIYTLNECQFYFDKLPHDDTLDMGNTKPFNDYEVSFDFKFSSMKYERWIEDDSKFGKYFGYNNSSLWKEGGKGRNSGSSDNINNGSSPKFMTSKTNSLQENGVIDPIFMSSYNISVPGPPVNIEEEIVDDETKSNPDTSSNNYPPIVERKKDVRKAKRKDSLDKFKKNSKIAAKNAARSVSNFVVGEVNNQISMRTRLLSNTIQKMKNALGFGGLENAPRNVYPKPYFPSSFGIFFDVRNDLLDFVGNDIAGVLGGFLNVLKPTQGVFKQNNVAASKTLSEIVAKYGKK